MLIGFGDCRPHSLYGACEELDVDAIGEACLSQQRLGTCNVLRAGLGGRAILILRSYRIVTGDRAAVGASDDVEQCLAIGGDAKRLADARVIEWLWKKSISKSIKDFAKGSEKPQLSAYET